MRVYTILAAAVLFSGALAAGAEPAPQKAELAFPVVGKPGAAATAPSVKCTAAFGPVTPVAAVAFSPDAKSLSAAASWATWSAPSPSCPTASHWPSAGERPMGTGP